jgi:hypothetical protein
MKLLTEEHDFGLPRRMRPEQCNPQSADKLQEIDHPGGRVTHRCIGPAQTRSSVRQQASLLLCSGSLARDLGASGRVGSGLRRGLNTLKKALTEPVQRRSAKTVAELDCPVFLAIGFSSRLDRSNDSV